MKLRISQVNRKPVFGVNDQVRHKSGSVMVRGLEFWTREIEESYYLCSEKKVLIS